MNTNNIAYLLKHGKWNSLEIGVSLKMVEKVLGNTTDISYRKKGGVIFAYAERALQLVFQHGALCEIYVYFHYKHACEHLSRLMKCLIPFGSETSSQEFITYVSAHSIECQMVEGLTYDDYEAYAVGERVIAHFRGDRLFSLVIK